MQNSKQTAVYIVLLILSVLAILFLIFKYNQVRHYRMELGSACTEMGEAKVIAANSHLRTGRKKYRATRGHMTLVTYYDSVMELKLDDKTYTIREDTIYPVKVGQTVPVHYSPADPSVGYVGNTPSASGSDYLNLMLIPGFVIAGIAARLGGRNRSRSVFY